MIFVTVGLHPQGFDRLVRASDEMASLVKEPVVIQRGASQYMPIASQFFDFADEAQMQEWLSKSRAVISHCGAGSILDVLQAGKPVVVVPRLKQFSEHLDDHQLELAKALAEQNKVVVAKELSAETLEKAVAQATSLTRTGAAAGGLQSALRAWLAEQATQPVGGWWSRQFRRKQRRD